MRKQNIILPARKTYGYNFKRDLQNLINNTNFLHETSLRKPEKPEFMPTPPTHPYQKPGQSPFMPSPPLYPYQKPGQSPFMPTPPKHPYQKPGQSPFMPPTSIMYGMKPRLPPAIFHKLPQEMKDLFPQHEKDYYFRLQQYQQNKPEIEWPYKPESRTKDVRKKMRKQNTINTDSGFNPPEKRPRPGWKPDQGFNPPSKRPRPGWKPDQGFYHPEPKPIYRYEPKPKRDKNGNIIVRLDNGSYVSIDPQGNASPYKPPKLPVFFENIFKPQYPPRRPDSWNPWPENPRPGPMPTYPERPRRPRPDGRMPIYPGSDRERMPDFYYPGSDRERMPDFYYPNPWKRPDRPRPDGRMPKNYPDPDRELMPGFYHPDPDRELMPGFYKRMSKRAIPTQRTDNTRNKYGI